MGSEWSDACASLIAFTTTSSRPKQEVEKFIHTIVRLFSLLHAMALEEIATLSDENFPLIDVQGFRKKDLNLLFEGLQQGRKMTVVLNWIKVYTLENFNNGVLAVPAPILTRVFQELGAGLVRCYNAQQIVIWPFPFPYTQMNLGLIYIYMLVTPVVISTWEDTPDSLCLSFTVVSMMCMLGLDLIASELENPLGDDPNDLPALELQHEMNRNLMCLLQPRTWEVPRLTEKALLEFEDLAAQNTKDRTSLEQYQASNQSTAHRIKQGKGLKWRHTKNAMKKQMSWATQVVSDHHVEGLTQWLHKSIDEMLHHQDPKAVTAKDSEGSTAKGAGGELQRETSIKLLPTALTPKSTCRVLNVSRAGDDDAHSGNASDNEEGTLSASRPATVASGALSSPAVPTVSHTPDNKDPPWREFLVDLDRSLKGYLDNQMLRLDEQLQSLGSLQAQQSLLVEQVLGVTRGGHWETGANKGFPGRPSSGQSSPLRCCAATVEQKERLR